mmetsp:Transcript_18611/g.45748  ORF Transcript_18611/g.45748 Transcript_18611/m.45748 type:complete len:237 (-) Transcript_18611:1572-2282(-)
MNSSLTPWPSPLAKRKRVRLERNHDKALESLNHILPNILVEVAQQVLHAFVARLKIWQKRDPHAISHSTNRLNSRGLLIQPSSSHIESSHIVLIFIITVSLPNACKSVPCSFHMLRNSVIRLARREQNFDNRRSHGSHVFLEDLCQIRKRPVRKLSQLVGIQIQTSNTYLHEVLQVWLKYFSPQRRGKNPPALRSPCSQHQRLLVCQAHACPNSFHGALEVGLEGFAHRSCSSCHS